RQLPSGSEAPRGRFACFCSHSSCATAANYLPRPSSHLRRIHSAQGLRKWHPRFGCPGTGHPWPR
ncbi:hypothetical protein LPJ75_004206, partial [Coemansia sp. RSA 2598]